MHKRNEKSLPSASTIAGPPIKRTNASIVKDGVERGRFAKKTEYPTVPSLDGTQATITRMEEELEEEEQWALSHEGRPRIEIYNDLFEEIIQKDKKYSPILRKIKAVYMYEIQSQARVELRELHEAHDNLVVEHKDLTRKYSQLLKDHKAVKKSLRFRNLQIFELEEMIARKEREMEHITNERVADAYQLPSDIIQSINKLRMDIEERSPARIEGYTSPATLETERLKQRIHELETEVRITKLRERDLYSKFLELKLHPPTVIVQSRPNTAPSAEQIEIASKKAHPLFAITRTRSRSMDMVKGLASRKGPDTMFFKEGKHVS